MAIEYEATFININRDDIRKKLKKSGATWLNLTFYKKKWFYFYQ